MIKALHINNFQSHQASELNFAPGLNVILGQSDSGKTAILRALYWLYANRPSGEAFRSSWGGDTVVDIELDEGQVGRIRSNKLNSYVLGMHDEFKALGKAVPEEIVRALNLTDLNWQMQFQPAFLLTDSPGEVARKLNEIVNLGKIDSTVTNLHSWTRLNTQDLKAEEARIEAQEEELGKYDYLEVMEQGVEKVEGWEREWFRLGEEREAISDLIAKIGGYTADITYADEVLAAESEVAALAKLEEELVQLGIGRNDLGLLINYIQEKENEILELGEELDQMQTEFNRLMPDVCPLCGRGD